MSGLFKRQRLRWFVALGAFLVGGVVGQEYHPQARWGQASVIVNDALYVFGGKVDEFNEFSYAQAPNTNDVLYLSLSSSFDVASPPWTLVSSSANTSTSQGPALAWSSLSAINWHEALHFGGLAHPNLLGSDELTDINGDSAVLLDVFNRLQPQWRIDERVEIQNQPARRFRHATATLPSGLVIISGGEKPDGSQTCLDDIWVFNPANLTFSPVLSQGDGPPGLCGHVSIPLPDGRVLFFGGYSSSDNALPDFSVIWVLDTTKTPYVWSRLDVAEGNVPRGRRAFAAALIDPDKILIHGGSDASFLNTFSDGWILDLGRSPAVWLEVPALSELGPRRDHFAVPQGNSVVFGFGYTTSEPASPGLQVFDTDQNTWVPSFTPAPPLITPTIPLPTQSGTSGISSGGLSTGSAVPSITSAPGDPNNPNNPGDSDPAKNDDKRKRVTAIAVSTTVGFLALVLAIVGVYFYRRHRHRRFWDERRFAPISGEAHSPYNDDDGDDDDSQFHRNIPRVAGFESEKEHGRLHGLAGMILGATSGAAAALKSRSSRQTPARRNMLDDEDAHDFSAWYDRRRNDGSGNSAWSLLSIFQGGRRSREASMSSRAQTPWREKGGAYFDPFSDSRGGDDEGAGLVAGGVPVRPKNRREASYLSTRSGLSYASYPSYTDPFQDPIQEEVRGVSDTAFAGDNLDDTEGRVRLVNNSAYIPHPPYPTPLQTGPFLPLEGHVGHALSPLSERTSQSTLPVYSSASSSDHMHDMSRFSTVGSTSASGTTSMTSSERPMSPTLLLSNMIPAPSERPQRSGSWWRRLSVSRQRNNSIGSRSGVGGSLVGYPSTTRDPNPPPRLVTIDEAASSQLSPGSKRSSPGMLTPRTGNTPPGEVPPPAVAAVNTANLPRHGKSSSSLRTTDTDLIDRMAGTMEVAQREKSGSGNSGNPSSHRQWRSSTDSIGDASSFASVGARGATRRGSGSSSNLVFSPTEMEPHESIAPSPPMVLPSVPPRTHSPSRVPPISMYNNKTSSTSPVSPTSPGGSVAAKIQEFEKKHRQSVGNAAEMEKSKERKPVVDYGLVPRRSLFVANPDHRKSQSSLESS